LQAGASAEAQRNFAVAITEFRLVTDLEPSSTAGFLSLGRAYMENGQYGAAIDPLKHALERDPDLLPAHQLLGYALLAQGYAAEAIPHLDKMHDQGALGIAKLEIGQAPEAVSNLQPALEKNPDDPDLLYYLSPASEMPSEQSVERLSATHPESARALQSQGHVLFAVHNLPEDEKAYQQALGLRPDVPGLHLELGQIYAEGSKWADAEKEFRAEAKLQPGSSEAAYRFGDALLQEGKIPEAVSELKRSNQLRPDMPETLYALGKAASLSADRWGRTRVAACRPTRKRHTAGGPGALCPGRPLS